MAKTYLPVDRDQLFLLPLNMREWLPDDHLAWFVIDVVSRIDTSALHARHPRDGAGRRAYDPDMLLALLVYAYCTGQRSSRQIERLCEVDVAYRVICANHVPDHTTIARFRQDHQEIAVQQFTDVLMLCAAAGLAKVGVVAVDGTKVGAAASLKANRTRDQVEAEVRAMLAEGAVVDEAEDTLFGEARGDELPPALADPRHRGARLDAALRQLEAQEAARREAEAEKRAAWEQAKAQAAAKGQRPRRKPPATERLAEAEAALTAEEAAVAERLVDRARREAEAAEAGRKPIGRPPAREPARLRQARQRLARVREAAEKAAKADHEPLRANVTDPDSRIMKTPSGFVQGYNAQAAVNDEGVVLAASVTQDANDVGQCEPMMGAVIDNLDAAGVEEPIGTMLFDAGYFSEDNLTAPGPDRLIATLKDWKQRRAAREAGTVAGPPPTGANPAEAMEHRLRTEEGAALYAKRGTTVEPVFGQHKENRGFRRFVRRGLEAVHGEWQLMNTAHNILKLHQRASTLPT